MYFSASAILPEAMPSSCARNIVWWGVWLRCAVATTSCRRYVLSVMWRTVSHTAAVATTPCSTATSIKIKRKTCRLPVIMMPVDIEDDVRNPADARNRLMAGLLTCPEKGNPVFPTCKKPDGFTFSDHN